MFSGDRGIKLFKEVTYVIYIKVIREMNLCVF